MRPVKKSMDIVEILKFLKNLKHYPFSEYIFSNKSFVDEICLG